MTDEREKAMVEKLQLPHFTTGAQINQQRAEVKRQAVNLIEDLKLRQWCVEQAVKLANDTDNLFLDDIEKIIEYFYNFITKKGGDDAKSA